MLATKQEFRQSLDFFLVVAAEIPCSEYLKTTNTGKLALERKRLDGIGNQHAYPSMHSVYQVVLQVPMFCNNTLSTQPLPAKSDSSHG